MRQLHKSMHAISVVGLALLFSQAAPARADDCAAINDYNDWLECLVKEAKTEAPPDAAIDEASIRAGVRSNRNQAETPAMAGNTTSLIDTSSATDLVSLAANIGDLGDGTEDSAEEDGTTGSATASTYALYSAVQMKDPLDHEVYCAPGAKWWRSFWVTFGFDDQEEDATAGTDNAVLIGAKFRPPLGSLLSDQPDGFFRSDVCDWKQSSRFAALRASHAAALDSAGDAFAVLAREVEDRIAAEFGDRFPACREDVEDDNCFPLVRQRDAEKVAVIARAEIRSRLQPFLRLDESIRENVEALNGQGDFSLSFMTRQRENGSDEYSSALIFQHALIPGKLDLTLNGSHELENQMDGNDSHGGRIAAAFAVQPFPDVYLAGPKPFRFTLAGEGKWMQDEKPLYKGQLKVNMPIPAIDFLSGLEIPLSVTIANRTDLIDETDVRGMIGFTLDTAQVLAEAKRRFLAQ